MSINISEKNFRIRMTKEQFNLLKKDGGFQSSSLMKKIYFHTQFSLLKVKVLLLNLD